METATRRIGHPVRGRVAWVIGAAILAAVAVLVGVVLTQPASAQGTSTGSVTAFGGAIAYGAPSGSRLNAPIVGMAATPSGHGYWLLSADGGVFTYGDARFFGSAVGTGRFSPYVGIAATPDGGGYWLVDGQGLVENFGDAPNLEGYGAFIPVAPVVGIAATHGLPGWGSGFWLVAADGGVFTESAPFYGSMGATRLNSPMVGMASTPDSHGYWLVASDGGVFSFGDAHFYGSMGGTRLNSPVVGMASTPDGKGYWLVAADGGIFSFGDAHFYGSLGATPPPRDTPVVAMASTPGANGYWVTTTDKPLPQTGPVPSVMNQCDAPQDAPAVRPTSILLACGDGDTFLHNLTWSSWTPTGASGTGTLTADTCTPDCAGGTFVSLPTTVHLSYPVETSAGREFATLSYTLPTRGGLSLVAAIIPTNAG